MGVNAMQCMKCGREIPAGDVFCQECLADMEKYPVKPGTVVHIPNQARSARRQQERRSAMTPERKVEILTRRIRALSWFLTLAVATIIAAGALIFCLLQEAESRPAIGQNYSSTIPSGETEETK